MNEVPRRRIATAIPFVLSFTLSLTTMGSTLHWQDSGFFLAAVKEMAVLYPPGFVLYLLLAKAWTSVLFFVDFTVAVHLFSATCAASAAAVLGRSVAALLRSRGKLFQVTASEPGPVADWVGAAIGGLAASGYTFWFAGIYAKGYAFYSLVLALLLRWMIRADDTRRPRDFTVVAALIGLAWQAHPSATLVGLALALFVGCHRGVLGWRGTAWRTGLAAACAAGPVLLLPLLALGDAASSFGDPRSLADLGEYFTGRRFVAREGSFGWEPTRFESVFRFGWEEFLPTGTVLAGLGIAVLGATRRRLLGWFAAWTVPLLEVTVLFVIEGQHDQWFVGAWLPLHLVAGVGLYAVTVRLGRWGSEAALAIGAAGVAWAIGANFRDLDLRGYDAAESFARAHLDSLEGDAILVVLGDDAASGVHYLQTVKGTKPGVLLVRAAHLERARTGEPSWYDRSLLRRAPDLRMPDYAGARARWGGELGTGASVAAFLGANAGSGRPIYLGFRLPERALPEGCSLTPAGFLWKLTRGPEDPDPQHWAFQADAERTPGMLRRRRGQHSVEVDHVSRLLPEAYESRLLRLQLAARRILADWNHDRGGWREAIALYESIVSLDGDQGEDTELLYRLGDAYCATGQRERGAAHLERALGLGAYPAARAVAHVRLAEIAREGGREPEVRRHLVDAEAVRPLPDDLQERIRRLRGR